MSCVPFVECGEGGRVTIEDLDRWTDSLTNVLASQEGRNRFKQYMENANLEEALKTLDFWEQCTQLMPKKSDGQDSPPHPSTSSSTDLRCRRGQHSLSQDDSVSDSMREDFRRLYHFADEYVNFDLSEMRELRMLRRAHTVSEVTEILTRTKTKAEELLRDEYHLFKGYLKEKGRLRRC